MDLIDRYIDAVSQYLPQKQQADIEKELRGLIEDMLMDKTYGEEPTVKQVEEVLTELGEPSQLAEKYQDKKRYLIGPALYGKYLVILKLVLSIVLPVVGFINAGVIVFKPGMTLTEGIVQLISSLWSAALGVVFWVTIGFIIAERTGTPTLEGRGEKKWKPSDLPPVTKKRLIPVGDIVAGATLYAFLIIVFCFAHKTIGVHTLEDGVYTFTPLFNTEVFNSYLPVLLILYGLSLVKELTKLFTRRWTLALWGINLILSISIVVFYAVMLGDNNLLSTGLTDLISRAEQQLKFELYGYIRWNIVIIIALWRGWESVHSAIKLYKTRQIPA